MKTSTKSILGGRVEVIGPADCVGAVASHIETTISGPAAAVQPLKSVLDDPPKHTPGPWVLGTNSNTGEDKTEVYGRNGHLCIAAELGSGPEAEANARLIAAAPDLLTACELFLKYETVNCHTSDGSVHDHSGDYDCPQCVVRAAIAKAKGGAS